MSSRNDRLNERMLSLDELTASFEDPTKLAVLSDGGRGVEAMLEQLDEGAPPDEPEEPGDEPLGPEERRRKLNSAKMRLVRAGLGYLVPTLELIANNGNNWEESVCQMMRR